MRRFGPGSRELSKDEISMSNSKGNHHAIRRVAIDVLEIAGITEPPVSVEKIAACIGATIRYEPAESRLAGMAYRSPAGVKVIGVNSAERRTRQRFTIAHEIGHLLLHQDDAVHLDEGYLVFGHREDVQRVEPDPKETQANIFASELLMPSHFLQRDFADLEGGFDLESDSAVRAFAQRYEVSIQTMTIRLSRVVQPLKAFARQ